MVLAIPMQILVAFHTASEAKPSQANCSLNGIVIIIASEYPSELIKLPMIFLNFETVKENDNNCAVTGLFRIKISRIKYIMGRKIRGKHFNIYI